jgi:DNA-binding NarL/FixJ family response regulator
VAFAISQSERDMATILVLDDDPYVPMLIESVVPATWIVVSAPNGLVGLDLLRQYLAKRNPLDLIILDLQMPGLDGYDTALRIRQLTPATPLLILTGIGESADPDLTAYAAELGCALLRKGIPPDMLGRGIEAACRRPPALHRTAALGRLQHKAQEAEAVARRHAAIRVGLFATDPVWLAGAAALLRDSMLVVGAAHTADQLCLLLAGRRIDVLVIAWQDLHSMRSRQPLAHHPPILVIVPNYYAAQVLRYAEDIAGVVIAGEPTTLIEAVQVTAAGGQYAPVLPATLPDLATQCAAHLTPRERELIALDQPGVSVTMLAQALGVAPKTIEQYRWRIRGKLAQVDG